MPQSPSTTLVAELAALEESTPRAIAGTVARQIRSGRLGPGERLPTVREVAAHLGVSPATVSGAWQALRRTGLVVSRGRAGSFVAGARADLSPRQRSLLGHIEVTPLASLDLSRGTPDPELLPPLGPALARVASRAGTGFYQDTPVLPELADVVRSTLPYSPEELTVVDGALDGIARTLEQVVSFGDRVALESPGFPPLFDLVETLGAEVVPLALDAEGVRPDALRTALRTPPAAIVLQPRAQNPRAISMSRERAAELAAILRAVPEVWIVEDDHSGPISASADVTLATWLPEQVVHVRSFSKSHGPDLRMAALGGPTEVMARIVARRRLGPAWTSRMLQTILLDLLTSPTPRAQVETARWEYHSRQQTLLAALAREGVELGAVDGINLALPVADERAALLHLAASGIRVAAGQPFIAPGASAPPFVRVTSGVLDGAVSDVGAIAARLAEASRTRDV